ncbi:MAG: sterol desaturase family protein [Halioglobus sp.]|nr:sterol desaturase family protein [Halioglobus sp.]
MTDIPINYEHSKARQLIAWTIYPLCVLVPTGIAIWAMGNGDRGLAFSMIPIGYLSAGIMEWIQPYCLKWRKSHGDIITDLFHIVLSGNFIGSYIKQGLALGSLYLVSTAGIEYRVVDWPGHWPLGLQLLLALVVAEFGTYWRHRLFHEYHIGWRFHAVHHSSPRLYWLNAPRFHFIDSALSGAVSGLMLALFGVSAEVAGLVVIVNAMHGNWQHCNVYYRLGWLNWLISSAELHRWHHSNRVELANSNYGNILIIFDVLFGTRRLPQEQQQLDEIGLGGYDDVFPKNWFTQALVPFFWKRMLGEKDPELIPAEMPEASSG